MSDLELTMMKRIGELKAELTVCKAESDRLKAEVERLRKAGDAMHVYLGRVDGTTNGQLPVRQDWDAAKDGKPSA